MPEAGQPSKPAFRQRHPFIFWGAVLLECAALLWAVVFSQSRSSYFLLNLLAVHLMAIPVILSSVNVFLIFKKTKPGRKWRRGICLYEILSILFGTACTRLLLFLTTQMVDWDVQIAAGTNHSPLWLRTLPTVYGLLAVGAAGYLLLRFTHAGKTPPLVTVMAVSALYIGTFEVILLGIQLASGSFLLCILPANCVIIAARVIRDKVLECKPAGGAASSGDAALSRLNRALTGGRVPLWALVFAFPLLGAVIALLLLFWPTA